MPTLGFSVQIYMPGGDPEGIRVLTKTNWIGLGLVFPRALFPEARRREEMGGVGVYVLWGPSESSGLPTVYIGEGDGVGLRFDQHARTKDFWTHAVVFTSKDQSLHKAHCQYLESRLIELAAAAKRCQLENGNAPQRPTLDHATRDDAERFLEDMLLCMPTVGVRWFEKPIEPAVAARPLYLRIAGVDAVGADLPGGFLVRRGATAALSEAPAIPGNIAELRRTLRSAGILEEAGSALRLTQDYSFNSPSSAAQVLLGYSASGPREWKDEKGVSLKDLRAG